MLLALLAASLLLYYLARFLLAPQPPAVISPTRLDPQPIQATRETPSVESSRPAEPSAPALSMPTPRLPLEVGGSPASATVLAEPALDTKQDVWPEESLARRLEVGESVSPGALKLAGVRLDGGSGLGLGRFQFGYGRWSGDAPAGLNRRNGTASEEPAGLYVKLRIRF